MFTKLGWEPVGTLVLAKPEGGTLPHVGKNKARVPAVTRSPLALQSLACLNHSQRPDEGMSSEALIQGSKWIQGTPSDLLPTGVCNLSWAKK